MTLTALQHTHFFTAGIQMGLSDVQRAALDAQGLSEVDDFVDESILLSTESVQVAFLRFSFLSSTQRK